MPTAPSDPADCTARRLRWRATKRGVRELDLLFTRLLDEHWDALDASERSAFALLLEEADQDILSWLTGSGEPRRELRPILARLRRLPVRNLP